MRCEAQDAPCGQATQAACKKAARPNPTGKIGEIISCHILKGADSKLPDQISGTFAILDLTSQLHTTEGVCNASHHQRPVCGNRDD